MHMAMKIVNGGQVVVQLLAVLVSIGALAGFIAASAKGTTNGVIAAGYIAALWCLAVNIYVLIAWRVTRKRPNPPKWAIKNIIALCLLHIFTAVLAIGCSVALSLVEICNHWDDDEDDDEDENGLNNCDRRTLPMYVGGGLLIALFAFHLIFSIVSCINMCYRKGSSKDRRGQHQPVPTQETAYAPGPYAPQTTQANTPYAPIQQQAYAPMEYSSQTQGSPHDVRAQGTPYTPSPQTEYSATHNTQPVQAYAQPPSREISHIDHAAPVTATTYPAGSHGALVELPPTEHTEVSTQGRTELA